MFTERLVLNKNVPSEYSSELQRRLFFVSADIVDFKLIGDTSKIQAIEVTSARPIEAGALSEKIHFMLANDIINQRIIDPKVIWRNPRDCAYQPNMFDRLVQEQIAYEAGEGQIGVGEPFIALMDYFDAQIRSIVMRSFGGKEYRYPTLIPTATLEKCGYFTSFPHFLMFVTRLHNDMDNYRAFLDEYRETNNVGAATLNYCQNLDYCLPPTMCYHTYHQFADRSLAEQEQAVITSRGKSFRFESRYHQTLERLWDFTIREIVFMGTRDFVLDCRQRFMHQALGLIEELELAGHCEVANDPFFCDQDTAVKVWSQKMLELKYELRINVDQDRTIAAGSFNFHDSFFGEGFNIRHGQENWVRTACVGFGLERLTYAFLCQHGLDRRRWPERVRREIPQ